jgi:hypothetical protein
MDLRVKKLAFPIVMALVGLLAVGVVATNTLAKSPSTAVIKVNDVKVKDGDKLTLPTGTLSVIVDVKPTDPNSTFKVTGDSGFVEGDNILNVKVNGADGKSFTNYKIILVQPKLSGWCAANPEKVKLYNDDYELADIYQDISLAYLDERLPEIKANLSCFSDLLQKYINENY